MPPANISELRSRAAKGDPDAQFALAASLSGEDPEAARHWLERAAENGQSNALFTLSASKISGVGGEADLSGAIEGLTRAKEGGNSDALRLLAALTALGRGVKEDWSAALAMIADAAKAGDAAALREIAILNIQAPGGENDGAALMRQAGRTDGFAAFLSRSLHSAPAPTDLQDKIFDRAVERLAAMEPRGRREDICARPCAFLLRGVFDPLFCAHLVGIAGPRLKREQIVDDAGVAHAHPTRTAFGASLGGGALDLPAAYAALRMSAIAELPVKWGEALNVLRYRPGEEYRVHHDFLSPEDPELAARGQRIRTALLYLNDGYKGGETHFLEPDIRISAKAGDVLVFDNVDEKGAPDVSARHAGSPVETGVKWLATIWFRDRDFFV